MCTLPSNKLFQRLLHSPAAWPIAKPQHSAHHTYVLNPCSPQALIAVLLSQQTWCATQYDALTVATAALPLQETRFLSLLCMVLAAGVHWAIIHHSHCHHPARSCLPGMALWDSMAQHHGLWLLMYECTVNAGQYVPVHVLSVCAFHLSACLVFGLSVCLSRVHP